MTCIVGTGTRIYVATIYVAKWCDSCSTLYEQEGLIWNLFCIFENGQFEISHS